MFRSVITSHSCFFFHFSNVEGCGSFKALLWDRESTRCGTVCGSLGALVVGEFSCDGTVDTSRDELVSKSSTDEDDDTLFEATEIDESFSALSTGFRDADSCGFFLNASNNVF